MNIWIYLYVCEQWNDGWVTVTLTNNQFIFSLSEVFKVNDFLEVFLRYCYKENYENGDRQLEDMTPAVACAVAIKTYANESTELLLFLTSWASLAAFASSSL